MTWVPLSSFLSAPAHPRCDAQALEPHISAQIMELHHSKHHQAYVNGLNAAEAAYAAAATPKERIALQAALRFNGGGHINHSLFWKNLAPAGAGGGALPAGPLKDAVVRDFGSLERACAVSLPRGVC